MSIYEELNQSHSNIKIKSIVLLFNIDNPALFGENGWSGKMLEVNREVERLIKNDKM